MYKSLFIIVLFWICSNFTSAQGIYDNCYFGTAGLNFSGWQPIVLTNSQMIAHECAVSISSENGDLLFYSNGGNSPTVPSVQGGVWNANHVIMENGILGDSSGCISSYQGAVAFPVIVNPENFSKTIGSSTYYIFMRDCVESSFATPYYNSGLTYCEIDMDANNGLGKVVSKNNVVVPFQTEGDISTDNEPLAAILNGNDDGWWVFSYNGDSLYSVEVGVNGIGNYKTHVVGSNAIIFSPSRDYVVVGNKLYTFDAISGDLSFVHSLSESKFAFSSNGKQLYGLGNFHLAQYDMTAPDIFGSKVTLSSNVSANNLFLAPDTRIYLFKGDESYIPGVINCPNEAGVNCGISMLPIDLQGRSSGDNFTNIPANFLYHDGFECNLSVDAYNMQTAAFEIYPNPSDGFFTLSVSYLESPKPFQILSVEGKIIERGTIRNLKEQIDLSSIPSGLYFVRFMGKEKRIVKL